MEKEDYLSINGSVTIDLIENAAKWVYIEIKLKCLGYVDLHVPYFVLNVLNLLTSVARIKSSYWKMLEVKII